MYQLETSGSTCNFKLSTNCKLDRFTSYVVYAVDTFQASIKKSTELDIYRDIKYNIRYIAKGLNDVIKN